MNVCHVQAAFNLQQVIRLLMNGLHPLFKVRKPQEVMGRSVAPVWGGEVKFPLSRATSHSPPLLLFRIFCPILVTVQEFKPLPKQTWSSLLYHSAHCCQRHIKPLLSTPTLGQSVICPTTLSLPQASDPLLSCCSGLLSA